jgi:hypothetical protein
MFLIDADAADTSAILARSVGVLPKEAVCIRLEQVLAALRALKPR